MIKSFQLFSKIYLSIIFILAIVVVGVIGFIFIEDYSLMDAFYMTVITVTTVGFQEVNTLSAEGRFFTTFLIILSFGTFAYSISVITTYLVGGEFNLYFKDYRVKSELEKISNHVIICGFGRNGEQSVKKLIAHQQNCVIIDKDKHRIDLLRSKQELLFVEGDATIDEILKKAGVERAIAIISALPADADNLFVVLSARQLNKDIKIISRASFQESYGKLKIAGADNVIMPDRVGGDHMASLVTTPDVVEFLDNIMLEGDANINLEEISINKLPNFNKYKAIKDLNVRYLTGCSIIGFKTSDGQYVINPGPETEIQAESKLFVLGNSEQIKKINKLFEK